MTHVTDFAYLLEEYEVPTYPGIMIMHAWLNISIERVNGDLDYYIDAIELEMEDGKTVSTFTSGSFLYDTIVPHLHKDAAFRDRIMSATHEHI